MASISWNRLATTHLFMHNKYSPVPLASYQALSTFIYLHGHFQFGNRKLDQWINNLDPQDVNNFSALINDL